MALRVAVATGNWSNPAIWNGGVLPSAGDVVASNNFTVTIDQNINVHTLTNTAQSIITAVPLMTSNTTPSGIVTGLGGTSAYIAFDGSTSQNSFTGANPGDFFGYEFTSPKAIDMFTFVLGGSTTANISFQSWDGSAWITLYTAVLAGVNTFTSPLIGNSVAYIKYRFLINTTGGNLQMRETYLYEYLSTTAAVAGGGFIVSTPQTITCTGTGIYGGSTSVITNTSAGTVNINSTTIYGVANWTINHNATGTLNITSNLTANAGSNNGGCLVINNTGIVNIVGTVATTTYARCITIQTANTLNITGDVRMDSGSGGPTTISVNANNSIINITGNVYGQTLGGTSLQTIFLAASNCVLNITGSIFPVTGTAAGNAFVITTSASAHYIKIIGTINAPTFGVNPVLISTSVNSINILSGPFICSPYGFFPYQVVRMHLIPTANSYIEFRDETTNGAVSPGAIAPATQLVSPATLVSSLAVSDVRFGIVYALSTLTGTLRMPTANQVTFGIPVDTTFGNAVLTAASVWDYLVANITTADSIGMRLKNVATPQTTGEQLEAFLRLD
jgi:hypothetical protein